MTENERRLLEAGDALADISAFLLSEKPPCDCVHCVSVWPRINAWRALSRELKQESSESPAQQVASALQPAKKTGFGMPADERRRLANKMFGTQESSDDIC